MPESKSLPEKESKLPVVVSASRTLSTSANKRTEILGALAVFAPLAVDVIYGLTRKWLSETTSSKAVSETSDKREAMKKLLGQPTGYRRRYRGSQIGSKPFEEEP